MVFSSVTFLFLFLPLVLLAYLVLGHRGRNLLLLAASLFFYFWGEQFYVLVMLASIAVNHGFGLLIDRARRRGASGKGALAGAISANLALLGFFKYADFTVENLNVVLAGAGLDPVPLPQVHLPIGISFFTFQAMSYVIDLYRGVCAVQRNPLRLGLYISVFPQLVAGPIVRYSEIAGQIAFRSLRPDDFAAGAQRFVWGLGKKVLIANPAGLMADQIFELPAESISIGTAWLGILCYTLQIYFDFSGYSDMAIGLGRMFGFRFPENFNYPYVSRSVREFWRRWHITLSSWFRDYLYIPLGGNRHGRLRTGFNLLLVFFLCGLWHGASWNFVLWGLVHGGFLVLERGPFGRALERLPGWMQHGYLLLVVVHTWVLFRVEELDDALSYFAAMYGLGDAHRMLPQVAMEVDPVLLASVVAGIALSLPLRPWLKSRWTAWIGSEAYTGTATEHVVHTARMLLMSGILLLSASSLAVGSYNPFIYFRF